MTNRNSIREELERANDQSNTSLEPQIVSKIIATGLTPTGRVNDLKLEMLEAVNTITYSGKIYRWDQYVTDMLKSICEKCQELTGIIRFPSLIICIAMYHLCLVGDK